MSTSTEQLKADLKVAIEAGDVELANAIDRKLRTPSNIPTGFWPVVKDVAKENLQHFRETGTQVAFAVPKAVAGLIDLTTMAKRKGNEQTGGQAFPHAEKMPYLSPMLQALQNKVQGRDTAGEVPAAMIEGAFAAPAGGAALASGAVSGGVTQAGLNAGLSPWVAVPAGIVAGGGTGAAANAGTIRPTQVLAHGRVQRALEGADPQALQEAARLQAAAQRRGVFILPSQGTSRQTPGLEQLETEAMLSHAQGGAQLKAQAFGQTDQARRLADELVAAGGGRRLPADEAAAGLQSASRERLLADQQRMNSITEGFFHQAGQNNAPIPPASMGNIVTELQRARAEVAGNREVIAGIDDLLRRLQNPGQNKQTKSAANLQKLRGVAAAQAPTTTAPTLRRVYQSFIDSLEAVNERTGARAYSDNVAGRLRDLANATVRDAYETAEPLYFQARQLQAGMRQQGARSDFDPQVQLSRASGNPENVLASLLQRGGDPLQEITQGVQRWLPVPQRGSPPNASMTQTIGNNPPAAADALTTALAQARDRAFQPSNLGATPPNAGAVLANAVAGTPAQESNLRRAIAAVGGQPNEALETAELLRALGRPTVVHGARAPATEIAPIDPLRAASPNPLQATQGRMRLVQVAINRLSDEQVIALLSRPDSVQALQQIPGAAAMTPRMQLAAVMAAAGPTAAAGATE